MSAEEGITSELLEHTCTSHHAKTVERIVKRCMALVMELIPMQVDEADITSPTSSILTADVVQAFKKVGGDFDHIVPFALLEARRRFRIAGAHNPADSGEYDCRFVEQVAIYLRRFGNATLTVVLTTELACEALARKIVASIEMREQYSVLSARFSYIEPDGDKSIPTSALEKAVDQHATFFLSSSESQRVVFALWKGLLVQATNSDGSIEYRVRMNKERGFLSSFDPSRMSVPRYQFILRIMLWGIFLVAYSWALQTPDRGFGIEDVVLYVQLLGYLLEELVMIYKIRSVQALGFWNFVNYLIFLLLGIAFTYRIADITTRSDELSAHYRLLSFQFMSSAAPLIWMRLLTIFDVYQYFGTLQIVLRRMLQESGIFFFLLTLLATGFFQALVGLDAADGNTDSVDIVVNSLLQAMLGSAQFDLYTDRNAINFPFNAILYYSWSALVIILLLNILIALFGSAYADSAEDSVATFMAFFAAKTIAAIRAPDTYVYVAPINLIEMFVVAPFELILSHENYARLNRLVMGVLFFVPLCAISIWETHFDHSLQADYLALLTAKDEYTSRDEDPEAFYDADEYGEGDDREMKISTVPFAELKKALPIMLRSPEAEILYQIGLLREEIAELKRAKA